MPPTLAFARWTIGQGRYCNEEHARIENAVARLNEVVLTLQSSGCALVVMKSLDHWPDLGNDLDLYTTASEEDIVRVFTQKLGAHVEARSWGDRLAKKWNFALPGLRESVEVHVQRLGQTGEHRLMAERFVGRQHRKRSQRIPLPGSGARRACDCCHTSTPLPTFLFPHLRHCEYCGSRRIRHHQLQ